MKPRYSQGTRVRIEARDLKGRTVFQELERYENQVGVVVNSRIVVAYNLGEIGLTGFSMGDEPFAICMYTIRLEGGQVLDDVLEYSLEFAL